MYALLGAYTLIGTSVAGMAITMAVRNDPEASAATVVGSTLLAAMLAAVTGYLYRPLFRRPPAPPGPSAPNTFPPAHLATSTA